MQNPEPDIPASWKPSRSIYGGSAVGTFIATILVAYLEPYFPKSVDPLTLAGAITGLCVFIASYFIPDPKP
jgi:uncharacterized membrane protein